MLRDKINVAVKWKDAFSLKINICVIGFKVNVSKHFEYEASCQLLYCSW